MERDSIIQARVLLGWQQKDLASAANLSQRRVSAIELCQAGDKHGSARIRLHRDMRKIADALIAAATKNKLKVDWTAASLFPELEVGKNA